MQQKFAFRKTLKKVAALGTSLAMVGITVSGALAAGLGDYSSTFSRSNTVVVYGAAGDDSAANADVVTGMPGGGSTITAETSIVEGALALSNFETGERADFEPGTNLTANAAFGQSCFSDSDDLGLLEWEQNINVKVDKDYTVNEQVCLGVGSNEARLATALSEIDEDYGTNAVLLVPKIGFNYSLNWQDNLTTNNLTTASSTKQIDIDNFLGKSMIITGATDTTMTALVGDKYKLNTGDTLVYGDHTISVDAIDTNDVLLSVDGDSETIAENSNKRIAGLEIHADNIIETLDGQGVAVLFIGDQASETFDNQDHFAGEDENNFLWRWSLKILGDGKPTLGVELAQAMDSDATNIKQEVMDLNLLRGNRRHLLEGDYICMPNHHECLIFEGPKSEMAREEYIIEIDDSVDLSGYGTSEDTLKFTGTGVGSDSGFKVDTNGDGTLDKDTDVVYLFWDPKADFDADGEVGEIMLFYEDGSNVSHGDLVTTTGRGYGWGDANSTLATSKTLFEIDNDDFDNAAVVLWDLVTNDSRTGGHIPQNLSVSSTNASLALIQIEFDDEAGKSNGVAPRLTFEAGFASSGNAKGIDKLGFDSDEDTNKYLRFQSNASNSNSSIAGFDEDVLADSGIIIEDPEGNYDDDRIVLQIPDDDEFEFWVRVAKPKGGAVVEGGGGTVASSISMMDTEVSDVNTLGKNVIAVGGPAVNRVTADLVGVAFPTYGSDLPGLSPGLAVLEMKDLTSGKMALLVYGWEKDDTRRAAILLKDPAVLRQKLTDAGISDSMSATVTGTTLEVVGITVA